MTTYKVFRVFFRTGKHHTVKRRLTLEQAQAHCSNPETSSDTCSTPDGKRRTRMWGPWHDRYTEE